MSILKFVLIAFVFVIGWRVSEAVSPDAIALTTGVLLGALLCVPVVLISLYVYNNERKRHDALAHILHTQTQTKQSRYEQPQIIVMQAHPQLPQVQPQQHMLPDLKAKREREIIVEDDRGAVDATFRVVGDEDSKW